MTNTETRIARLEDRFHLLIAVLLRRGTLNKDEWAELRLQSTSITTKANVKARA